jgi:hypothetical protein
MVLLPFPIGKYNASSGDNWDANAKDALAKHEKAVQSLFPSHGFKNIYNKVKWLMAPSSNTLSHYLEENTPAGKRTVPDYNGAVAKATENPYIDTIFFVNFVPGGLDDKC